MLHMHILKVRVQSYLHLSWSSISDFRPSAVQSDTIQPHSTVLNGKAPYVIQNVMDVLHPGFYKSPYFVHVPVIFFVVGWIVWYL